MTQIYFGVDGTGPSDNKTYEKDFQRSFVNVFKQEFSWNVSGYSRGPEWKGLSTTSLGADAADFVKQQVPPSGGVRPFICLAGYSRGGAAVIHACSLLKAEKIAVDCLLLFDAVDRAVNLSGVEKVPSNVERVYHARRHPDASSRPYFGNCGTFLAKNPDSKDTGIYKEQFFYGTHGAIGGVPWTRDAAPEPISLKTALPMSSPAGLFEAAIRSVIFVHQVKTTAQDRILESDYLPTNVTYEQDAAAARQVGAWMRRNLTVAKMSFQMSSGGGPVPSDAGRAYA